MRVCREGVANAHPIAVESAFEFRTFAINWNIGTSVWLRKTVYDPLVSEAHWSTSLALLASFTICGFWHGLEPGYYITWFTGGLVDMLCKGTHWSDISSRIVQKGAVDAASMAKVPPPDSSLQCPYHELYVCRVWLEGGSKGMAILLGADALFGAHFMPRRSLNFENAPESAGHSLEKGLAPIRIEDRK